MRIKKNPLTPLAAVVAGLLAAVVVPEPPPGC